MIFNNPERHNAVSLEMWDADQRASSTTSPRTTSIRVVVLTGAGGKAFVSGADISKFESERAIEDAISASTTRPSSAPMPSIQEFPKPTIAMIRGYCIGGGLGLAVCCDLRICSDNSQVRACRRPSSASATAMPACERLVDVVGPAFAKEIFFTARQFDAAEALHDGPGQPRRAGGRAREPT